MTGGIGTEKLSGATFIIDIKSKYDKKYRTNSLGIKLGIDGYGSAP